MDKVLQQIYALTEQDFKDCARHLMIGGGTRGGPVIVRGKGIYLFDDKGKSYLDCTSQSWAMYAGFANPEIKKVIIEHLDKLTHVHQGFDTPSRYYLARKLSQIMPGDLNRSSFTVGGGLAIEAAMKIACKNTQPSRDFICLMDSYHGTTLGTMGASWISTRTKGLIGGSRFLSLTKPFIRVPNPYCYRCPLGLERKNCSLVCAKILRTTIERGVAGNAAGFIMEPIQASGGQIIAPKEYVLEARKICDETKTPLIFDEIQTYGRIGEFSAGHYYGVAPDMSVLGKGFGAGLPIAAVVISDKLEGFEPDAEELHTFANNSLAQVAAAKLIDLLENGLLENTRKMGAWLKKGLLEIQKDFPEIGDIRQAGLHIGVELVRDPAGKEPLNEEGKKVREEGLKNGIIFGAAGFRGNILKIKPPLIVKQNECDEILAKFRSSLQTVLRK